MLSSKNFSVRVQQLIDLANKTLSTSHSSGSGTFSESFVSAELYKEFRTSSLSFIKNLFGEEHPYYKEFDHSANHAKPYYIEQGRATLTSIKNELDGGWLVTMKGLVSAEIFSDFLEMSAHLLQEGYKDPAAVMIGSVLEEHLRQLCTKNNIPVEEKKSGKLVFKKADLLNAELANASVYNKLDQKNVTAWLDLRNKAAHGKYSEYSKEQVELMMQAVTEFMTRNSV